MAMLVAGSRCALCNQILDLDKPLFATSGVFFPPEHPLFRFCDAPLHWECYAAWPKRQEFARGCFEACIRGSQRNPYWGMALRTERVAVTVNPAPAVSRVQVLLAETGSRMFIPLGEWEHWLADLEGADEDMHPMEQAACREVLPELRATLPTADSIVVRVDWTPKHAQQEAEELARLRAKEERQKRARDQNEECRRLLQRGITCPQCGASDNIRFVDRGLDGPSFFVCKHCGRSFGP